GVLVWARLTFGWRSFHGAANPTEGGLVTKGPYRWLRHPIYASFIWFVWTAVIDHPGMIHAALAAVATAATAVRIVAEERLVVERYPEYAAYKSRTKRIIPFVF
ncbi:MAG TPA: isoprenylcysteine carboxylmethyltransferase family protein, partial [Dongiaceae bacterium]|nr:isoprenylcysteine carboxylmethyltransferase family protein [Dongiaceae bacterium]